MAWIALVDPEYRLEWDGAVFIRGRAMQPRKNLDLIGVFATDTFQNDHII